MRTVGAVLGTGAGKPWRPCCPLGGHGPLPLQFTMAGAPQAVRSLFSPAGSGRSFHAPCLELSLWMASVYRARHRLGHGCPQKPEECWSEWSTCGKSSGKNLSRVAIRPTTERCLLSQLEVASVPPRGFLLRLQMMTSERLRVESGCGCVRSCALDPWPGLLQAESLRLWLCLLLVV